MRKFDKAFRLTIGRRIAIGFMLVIIFSAISSVYTFYTLSKGISRIDFISNNVEPSIEVLNEFYSMVLKTKMYSGNWVYQQANETDKAKLRDIGNTGFSKLKGNLALCSKDWENEYKLELDTIIYKFETLLSKVDQDVIKTLTSFEDYNNPMKSMMTQEALESKIYPTSDQLLVRLESLMNKKLQDSKAVKEGMRRSFVNLGYLIFVLLIAVVVLAVLTSLITSRSITNNIQKIKSSLQKLMKGEITDNIDIKARDEIGEMGDALNQLIGGLKSYATFAQQIGEGNFETEFAKLSEKDIIGNALLTMRENLKRAADEDDERKWMSEGINQVSGLLRVNNENLETLSTVVIKQIVQYLNVNQGGIYLADNSEAEDRKKVKLYLTGCYAYDRLKLAYKEIVPGEGYVGQCWLEAETIHITNVPKNYTTITSGLGEATPTSILVTPLKSNDVIYGALELASFSKFTKTHIEFVEKLCEIIASSISSVKVTETTQKLLRESKELTESLQAQEEELRQNQEEMHATQEEAERKYEETQRKLDALEKEHEELQDELKAANEELKKLKDK